MTPDRRSNAASAVGASLIALGAFLPARVLLGGLGVIAAAGTRQLWLGAVLFRLGLLGLGLYLAIAGRLPIWNGESRPKDPAPPQPRWVAAILACILLAALGLRLHRLGVGLWFDEIAAYAEYMRMSFGEILTSYPSESQHFHFTLLARAAFLLFGEGPESLRLPSAVFGTASVGAVFLLGRRVSGWREALLSAALLTVSYHHVWFSQNARGYTILLFWTVLSSWLLLAALDQGRTRLWICYAIAIALGMFTHVTMLFTVLGHAAFYAAWLVRARTTRGAGAWSGAVLGFGLAGLLSFQLYALVIPQFFSAIGAKAASSEWANPLWTALELARGLHTGFAGSILAVGALVVFGTGMVSFARQEPAIVVFFVLPAAAGTAALMATGHAIWPRFYFFLMGFGVLIAVRGSALAGHQAARALRLPPGATGPAEMAIALVLILASATTVPTAWLPKQDFLGARGFLEAQRQAGDAVVTVGLATFPYSEFYRTGWESADSVAALQAIRSRARRTWVVYTIPMQLQGERPELMDAIRRDFPVVRKFGGTVGGGTIYLCRAEGASTGGASRRS